MSATANLLQADQALAKRWLRTQLVPTAAWQWLGGRGSADQSPFLIAIPARLEEALAEFSRPLAGHSNALQQQALSTCLKHVAAIFAWTWARQQVPAAGATERMLAACILPLYRGLASGSLDEICSVLKRQLADTLALTALEIEFSDGLPQLIHEGLVREKSPYQIVDRSLNLDLSRLAQRVVIESQHSDRARAGDATSATSPEFKIEKRPDWGEADVLWRLAGELISDRTEFIVPRSWINVPVPWNDASEHWKDVAQTLNSLDRQLRSPNTSSLNASLESSQTPSTTTATHSSTTPASVAEVATQSDDAQELATQPVDATHDAAEGGFAVAGDMIDEITRLKLEIEIANSVDALVQASRGATRGSANQRDLRPDGASGLAGQRTRDEEAIFPKIIIAEVRSHNDPAFVTVVKRQLALCRAEERTLSLVAVRVEPDGEEGEMPTLQSLGLASWQQQLVNWMVDHPEIHDPYAFVSSEGELILCLMDIERNTATGLLRQGLIEVLTGQALSSDNNSALARVNTPARYHSGIGSVCSPSAGFAPEQLIEATYRCLAAAERHGKASIKSIEVF